VIDDADVAFVKQKMRDDVAFVKEEMILLQKT